MRVRAQSAGRHSSWRQRSLARLLCNVQARQPGWVRAGALTHASAASEGRVELAAGCGDGAMRQLGCSRA